MRESEKGKFQDLMDEIDVLLNTMKKSLEDDKITIDEGFKIIKDIVSVLNEVRKLVL